MTARATLFGPILVAMTVAAQPLAANPFADADQPRGLVKARSEASIATEIGARVLRIPFGNGASFAKGDTLVEFDCRRHFAELEALRAEQEAARLAMRSNEELSRHRAVGKTELEISRAKVAETTARARALEIRTSQCVIEAPFDGRVVERLINEHETPQANAPLIRIVEDRALEIEIIAPSRWLLWLEAGQRFQFEIDELASRFGATVTMIGAVVDPISQTVIVKATFDELPDGVLAGMSGTAMFEQVAVMAPAPGRE